MPTLSPQTTPYYGGGQVLQPVDSFQTSGAPTTANINHNVPTLAADPTAGVLYCLLGKAGGSANWVIVGGSGSGVNGLAGDTGTAAPSGGSITLAGGTGISTVASGSTVTFNVTGIGAEYSVVSANTQMSVNQGYITNKAATAAVMTLPTTSSVGAGLSILGFSSTGWSIAQNAGQSIHYNGVSTTAGAGGSLASTDQYNTVNLICIIANTDWIVESSTGILTVT